MVSELEELVGFLGSPRQDIRQIALENLLGYTAHPSQASIFKTNGLKPIKDLMTLVRDKIEISENALTCLINLSDDASIVNCLISDKSFVELLLSKLYDPLNPSADSAAMLMANMSKNEKFPGTILDMSKIEIQAATPSGEKVIDQILDIFVKGADGGYNKEANFDYLAYFLADIAMHPRGRSYFVEKRNHDNIAPLSKVVVFTEHGSLTRRLGVASAIKNTLFNTTSHRDIVHDSSINLFPYLLLPLMGSEEYSEEEMLSMPEELQFLDPGKTRETDESIIITHLESILMLTTTKEVRAQMRELSIYAVIREIHLAIESEKVRDVCQRIVDVLQRDDASEDTDVTANNNDILQTSGVYEIEGDEIVDIV